MLFCYVLCDNPNLQLSKVSDMAETFHLSFCVFSDFRYAPSDVYFPGYTSGTVYECTGAYDDALYDGNS